MIVLRPASPAEREHLFDLVRADAATYLGRGLDVLGFTWEALHDAMVTVGRTVVATVDGEPVCLLWLDAQGEVLHLHAIVVLPAWRRLGIGPLVLRQVAAEHLGRVDVVELGVHDDNPAAYRLYERLGFEPVARRSEAGFTILQCPVGRLAGGGPPR